MTIDLLRSLETSGVRFVRILWCDNANVLRGKAVHIGVLPQYAQHGVGISTAQQAVPATVDAPAAGSGLGPVGEVRLVPDWSTLVSLPYAPGHARVLGDMIKDGQPWPYCPRHFLRRVLADAARDGLEFQAAFENEFYLLRPTADGFEQADSCLFAQTLAMDLHRPVIGEIAEALVTQGLQVEQYYPESGPGQQEISIRYAPALAAADRQIAFRETVHAVARKHGLIASFLPKIFADQAGSGCHLHLSLWKNGQNVTPDAAGTQRLSAEALGFIAGVLNHLGAIMAITTPSPNSYRRLLPHCWSGAFRTWGIDNREAAIRVPSDPAAVGPTHLEVKTVDGSANPYLALGVVLAAGLDGIRRKLSPGQPATLDPGNVPGSERLPENLGQSLERFRKSEFFVNLLGPELHQAFTAVRQAEWETLKNASLEEEVGQLLERY